MYLGYTYWLYGIAEQVTESFSVYGKIPNCFVFVKWGTWH